MFPIVTFVPNRPPKAAQLARDIIGDDRAANVEEGDLGNMDRGKGLIGWRYTGGAVVTWIIDRTTGAVTVSVPGGSP